MEEGREEGGMGTCKWVGGMVCGWEGGWMGGREE